MIPPRPNPFAPSSDYLTAKQAAAMLGICAKTLRDCTFDISYPELRTPGQRIPALRLGRQLRYSRALIDAVMNGQYSPPAAPVTPMRQRRTA
jgi:hypothetical protein